MDRADCIGVIFIAAVATTDTREFCLSLPIIFCYVAATRARLTGDVVH